MKRIAIDSLLSLKCYTLAVSGEQVRNIRIISAVPNLEADSDFGPVIVPPLEGRKPVYTGNFNISMAEVGCDLEVRICFRYARRFTYSLSVGNVAVVV